VAKRKEKHEHDIPGFIFPGAVVAVHGREETVKDYALKDGRLELHFRDGSMIDYNPDDVRRIPGRIPDFIREGAKLRVNMGSAARRHMMPPVLDWTISSFGLVTHANGEETISLTLKVGKPPQFCMHDFDPRVMTPVEADEKPPALEKPISVSRPLRFRLK
jgi:hypothetical protein